MNYRLQFTHSGKLFNSREDALNYISEMYNAKLAGSFDSLFAEPYVVQYSDPNIKDGELQVILAVGKYDKGEMPESGRADDAYQIIDSAFVEQEIVDLSGATVALQELVEEIKEHLEALQEEVDRIEAGAGLDEDGNYHANITVGDNVITYISDATSLNDADVLLDKALKALADKTITGIEVNTEGAGVDPSLGTVGVVAEVRDGIAYLKVSSDNIPIGDTYEGKVIDIHHDHSLTNYFEKVDEYLDDEAKRLDKKIEGIHIEKLDTELEANVREAFRLVDENGLPQGDVKIKIYKDSSLVKVQIGHMGATVDPITGEITDGPEDASEAMLFVYLDHEGRYMLIPVNLEQFIMEAEFKDGLVVNEHHEVYVKIDETSEGFLTVSANGVKLSGVQDAIDNAKAEALEAVADEKARAEKAEATLDKKIDDEIARAETKDADLEKAITDEADRAEAAEDALDKKIDELSGSTEAALKRMTISSEDNTIVIKETTDGTDVKVNLDNKTVVADEDGKLQTALKIAKFDATASNIREEYGLVDAYGNEIAGTRVKVYNDTSDLYQVYLGNMDDYLADDSDPSSLVITKTGDAALCFIYKKADGKYVLVKVNVEEYLSETEFKDGLRVEGHSVYVKIEEHSEPYLTVGPQGLYLSGIKADIDDEKTRAEGVEKTLSDAIAANATAIADEKERAEGAEAGLDERIKSLEAVSIDGAEAIQVTKGDEKIVSLLINTNDKILTQGAEGLYAHVSAEYDSDAKKIYLYGKNDVVLSTIDTRDFIKDGMVDTVSFDPETKILTIVFNTDSGKNPIDIDMSSLVDEYKVDDDSLTYLSIKDFKVAAKVDVENGLASYNAFDNFKKDVERDINDIEKKVDTLNGDLKTAGSVKHTIDDSLVKFKREGSKVESDDTLMRYYMDGDDAKYYVSNNAVDMQYKGQNLETVITELSGSGEETKDALAELSAQTVILKSELETANERIETLEKELEKTNEILNNLIDNLDTTIKTTVAAILKGKNYEIKVDATDVDNIEIGFADNAVFGPISLS